MTTESRVRVFFRTFIAWDLLSALAGGAVLLAILLLSDRELVATGTVSIVAIPFGMATCAANIVSLRWVSDRMRDTAYGHLVHSLDEDESVVILPYKIVVVAGGLTSLMGLLGYVADGELPRTATALVFSGLLTVGTYSLLGTLSLFRMSMDHQRRSARLQSIEERMKRERRASGRKTD